MRVTVFCTESTQHTRTWVVDELVARGHDVDEVQVPEGRPRHAAVAGNRAGDSWFIDPPDCALALGWEAGLAAHVAAREPRVPVVVRLSQAAREHGSDRARLEVALARSSALALVPSTGELDRVAELGVPRRLLRVLPEAVDLRRVHGDAVPDDAVPNDAARTARRRHRVAVTGAQSLEALRRLPGCETLVLAEPPTADGAAEVLRSVDLVVADDDSDRDVAAVLVSMACGVPSVARGPGALVDVVADGVTGIVVPRHADVTEPLRSLLTDPMRRQSMGMAAVDRVRARFASTVVGDTLERLLAEAAGRREPAAAS